MSLGAAVLASLSRALVVAALVSFAGGAVAARLRAPAARPAPGALALLAVLAAPAFAVGYAWAPALVGLDAPLRHVAATILLSAILLPVGAGLAWLAPPAPLSPRARHVLALARESGARPSVGRQLGFVARGPVQPALLRGGVVFLLAFGEFELAAVLGEPAWTVWLFDAQVGGLPLGDTLRHAAVPASIELAVLLAVAALARTPAPLEPQRGAAPARRRTPWTAIAFLLTVVTPIALIGREAAAAGPTALRFAVAGEVGSSILFAGFAAAIAGGVALGLVRSDTRGVRLAVLAAPGLCGGLVVALFVQATFQLPVLRAAYDTPLPSTLALAVVLLPLAVALRLVWLQSATDRSVHAATLARAGAALWILRDRPCAVGVALLFARASFELVASAMLAPSGWTPASVRLYNLMHYGHSAGLSAMVAGTVLAVALVVAFGLGATRTMVLGRNARG